MTAPTVFQADVLRWAGRVKRTRFQVENLGYESAGSVDGPPEVRYRWSCNDCGTRSSYTWPSKGAASEAARRAHPRCPA